MEVEEEGAGMGRGGRDRQERVQFNTATASKMVYAGATLANLYISWTRGRGHGHKHSPQNLLLTHRTGTPGHLALYARILITQ
jgi:hypothetical protein